MRIGLSVNGSDHILDVEPRTLLVEALREGLGLTGTHVGCDTTSCGACTVLFDGQPVKSCTVLAVQAEGHPVTTVEGLTPADGLSPVQEAFRLEHGLQCGFCTPGMIVSATALLARVPRPDDEAIRDALHGNLCRCTGYVGIVRAVRLAAAMAAGESPEPEAGRALEEPLARSRYAARAAVDDSGMEVV